MSQAGEGIFTELSAICDRKLQRERKTRTKNENDYAALKLIPNPFGGLYSMSQAGEGIFTELSAICDRKLQRLRKRRTRTIMLR